MKRGVIHPHSFNLNRNSLMKSKLVKISIAAGLLAASAGAFASVNGCCGSIECCLKMLASCC